MNVKSSKPKKQRKFFYKMPLHKRQKNLASNVSQALRASVGSRALSLRKGDKVKVMRGSNKGFEGKVSHISYDKLQVFIEKLGVKKGDGSERPIPLHASNLMITSIDKNDARRIGKEKKTTKKDKKTEEKKVEKTEKKEKAEKPEEKKKTVKKVNDDGEKGRKKMPKKN